MKKTAIITVIVLVVIAIGIAILLYVNKKKEVEPVVVPIQISPDQPQAVTDLINQKELLLTQQESINTLIKSLETQTIQVQAQLENKQIALASVKASISTISPVDPSYAVLKDKNDTLIKEISDLNSKLGILRQSLSDKKTELINTIDTLLKM